jgi:hypothetical protein
LLGVENNKKHDSISISDTARSFSKVSFEMPSGDEKDILNCRAELIQEGNNIRYILKDGHIIAVIGYKE